MRHGIVVSHIDTASETTLTDEALAERNRARATMFPSRLPAASRSISTYLALATRQRSLGRRARTGRQLRRPHMPDVGSRSLGAVNWIGSSTSSAASGSPRTTVTFTVSPGLRLPSRRGNSSKLRMGLPSIATMTSP